MDFKLRIELTNNSKLFENSVENLGLRKEGSFWVYEVGASYILTWSIEIMERLYFSPRRWENLLVGPQGVPFDSLSIISLSPEVF